MSIEANLQRIHNEIHDACTRAHRDPSGADAWLAGSVLEFEKVLGPLTDPVAQGGSAEDAFHAIVPSLPGFGFSDRPRGWNPGRTAQAWFWKLRKRERGASLEETCRSFSRTLSFFGRNTTAAR